MMKLTFCGKQNLNCLAFVVYMIFFEKLSTRFADEIEVRIVAYKLEKELMHANSVEFQNKCTT